MIELICQKQQTLQQFTDENCAQASFCFQQLLKEKEIKLNGKKIGENVSLQIGDVVRFYLTPKQQAKQAFSILYEDENILIADKDSGVNSEAVFAELCREKGDKVGFIHRLDRNTRGLLAFSLTASAEEQLLQAFKEKRVEKTYHALCFGKPKKDEELLTAYLKKDENRAVVRIFDNPTSGAEKILTQYRILQKNMDTTKLEIILHTGKTHQIRAHMAHIGCPIVGDMKYGNADENRRRKTSRQQLVAKRLHFSFDGALAYLNGKTFESQFETE
jgi:23S rRNA pseudouridine955/2504/2580 synthase